MSMRHLCLAALLATPFVAFAAGAAPSTEGQSIALAGVAPDDLHQCSRPSPEGVTATWVIGEGDRRQVDADLPRLTALKTGSGRDAPDPFRYDRQYIGIIVGDQRLIYINAFGSDGDGRPASSTLMRACDGGSGFWGAIYDPVSRSFSHLAFNDGILQQPRDLNRVD